VKPLLEHVFLLAIAWRSSNALAKTSGLWWSLYKLKTPGRLARALGESETDPLDELRQLSG
jgi:hypothetical protein